jgi:predicted dienelactone hydrolase
MRTIEMLLWVTTAMWAGWWVLRRPGRFVNWSLGALSLLLVVLHASVEGTRVHMAPVYILTGGLVALLLTTSEPTMKRRRWLRVATGLAVALAIVIGGALPRLFPVFAYETPTGPYGIGTADYEVPNAPDGRTLVIQTWYPAAPGGTGVPAGITSRVDLLETVYASFTGLPRPLFDNLRLVKTHARRGVPLAPGSSRFPVVLFSHGPLGANRVQSIFQMEALASHGYVVVAIDHTGYASTTIFPDGHAVPPDSRAAWPVFVDAKSSAMLRTWSGDVRAVIDRVEALNARDPGGLLTERLDVSRIGYIGASFGGSVVVETLLNEPRIKAGVAQDGKPYFFDDTPTGLQRPLMYMQSAAPYMKSTDAQLARWGLTGARFKAAEQDHYARQMRLFGTTMAPIYNVYIRGTNHLTFSDLYLIINLPDPETISITRAHRIINDYTLAFLDRYLNDAPADLVDEATPSPYPEVTVARRNIASARRAAK